ncbi:hypothetical protein EWT52_27020 [Escherichia coli O25b:H4]|nr:hypothetical protein EWT52_27020 [Escherichia coli O25b:H4]
MPAGFSRLSGLVQFFLTGGYFSSGSAAFVSLLRLFGIFRRDASVIALLLRIFVLLTLLFSLLSGGFKRKTGLSRSSQ